MLRRTPLKAKRATPRRNEGRVQHGRMKRRAVSKTAEEARHLKLVAGLGCLICGAPASVHHLMHAPGKERRRDHRFVAPLCPIHHQGDEKDGAVHGLGGEAQFYAHWGVDLVAWAVEAWRWRDEPEAAFWPYSVTRCRAVARPVLLRHRFIGRGAPKDEQPRSTRPDPTARERG